MSRRNPSPDLWIFGGLLLVAAIVRVPALADAVQAKFATFGAPAVANTSDEPANVSEAFADSTPAPDARLPPNASVSSPESEARPAEQFTFSIGRGGCSSRCGGTPW